MTNSSKEDPTRPRVTENSAGRQGSSAQQLRGLLIRARAALVRNRTTLVNAARGLTKSYGERLGRGNARSMKPKAAEDLSPELKNALGPLMREIESVSERIRDYDELLESMAQDKYPEAERLKQIKGVGTLIALTYMLTPANPGNPLRTLRIPVPRTS